MLQACKDALGNCDNGVANSATVVGLLAVAPTAVATGNLGQDMPNLAKLCAAGDGQAVALRLFFQLAERMPETKKMAPSELLKALEQEATKAALPTEYPTACQQHHA